MPVAFALSGVLTWCGEPGSSPMMGAAIRANRWAAVHPPKRE
ncbi:MAG: hypothetical protein AAB466_07250 [Verrucomicrobiota bacterium]